MTDGDEQLLAQDDIDALLGEAGLDGGYDENKKEDLPPPLPEKQSSIKYAKISDKAVQDILYILHTKAYLEREDDVRIIWNASGTISMSAGMSMKIQDTDYTSLGVLFKSHLVVRHNEENQSS